MKPPITVEFWTHGNPHILEVAMSLPAAERVYSEAVAKLRRGEIVRVIDATGTLLFSTDTEIRMED